MMQPTVIAIYEKMEAAAALHEINEAIGNIPNGASASVGNISESLGFINAWKYNTKRKMATDAQVTAVIASYGTNFYNLTQANLEAIKSCYQHHLWMGCSEIIPLTLFFNFF